MGGVTIRVVCYAYDIWFAFGSTRAIDGLTYSIALENKPHALWAL